VGQPKVKASIAINGPGATLASKSGKAEVTRAPFRIVVKNAQGETPGSWLSMASPVMYCCKDFVPHPFYTPATR
jgi:hypothetical protein